MVRARKIQLEVDVRRSKRCFFHREDKDNVRGMFCGPFSLCGKKLAVKEDEFEA